MSRTYKIGWFSTGRGPGSRALLKAVHEAIKAGTIQAQIEFVFCSRDAGESEQTDLFLKMVSEYQLPLVTLSCRKFKSEHGMKSAIKDALPAWRLDYDREITSRMADFNPNLCVLAGYMLVAGRELCNRYDMINLHPAAPGGPAGTWQEVIWQLIGSGAKETGVMMHLVTPELDKGPPVTFCKFSIRGDAFDACWAEIKGKSLDDIRRSQGENNALFKLIRKCGLAREFPLIIATIKAFSQGRVRITQDKKVVDSRNKIVTGYDLSKEVESQVILP